ncbi:MAG: GntR family transcriptional regulator [Lachnospiraceae bacterium]|nr:GntR family transcriptional regulator [Lachnospiraceae bacterium]
MLNNLKLNMEEYLPLRDVVFKTLRQGILKGELAPGERLLEVQLAERLGVSRTPVREAIHKLAQEGLVVLIPRKGAEVASISEKSLRDVLEVRMALETLAVRLACERMTEEELLELKQRMQAFEEAVSADDLLEITKRDEEFHDTIYAGTHNEKLVIMINNLREQMYRYRMEYIKERDKRQMLVQEHQEITDCICKKHAEEAKQAIYRHIDNQVQTVAQIIREQ